MKNGGWVYILASGKMGTLYVGSTSDLELRMAQHKHKIFVNSFTAKYNVNKLVYMEYWESLENMVKRERQMKEWKRNWKVKLIVQKNPGWNDFYQDFLDETIDAKDWLPEHAIWSKEQVCEFNRRLRKKMPAAPPFFNGVTRSRPSPG